MSRPERTPGETEAGAPAERSPRRRRWLWRTLIVLAVLIVLVIAGVQAVLWSGIPRRLVVGAVEKQLGLRLQVGALATGWFGHTQLNDVKVSLPLAEDAFLTVDRLDVTHTWLGGIIVRRGLTVHAVHVHDATLAVTQDAAGDWNIQEVAKLLQRLGGEKQATQSPQPTLALPALTIDNLTVHIVPNDRPEATIQHVVLRGRPESGVAWEYTAQAGAPQPRLTAKGQLVPGGSWQHKVTVTVGDVGPWLAPWTQAFPPSFAAAGTWDGQFGAGMLSGRLVLKKLHVPQGNAVGALRVTVSAADVTVAPETLTVTPAVGPVPQMVAAGGEIHYAAGAVRASDLLLKAWGGRVVLAATYEPAAGTGSVRAVWQHVAFPPAVTQAGDLDGTFSVGSPLAVRMTVHSQGATAAGAWHVAATVDASGTSLSDAAAAVTVAQATWAGSAPSGLAAGSYAAQQVMLHVTRRGPEITLDRVGMGAGKAALAGGGAYSLATHGWQLQLAATDWTLPVLGPTTRITLDAHGSTQRADLTQLALVAPGLEASATGAYVFGVPKPLGVTVDVTRVPLEGHVHAGALPLHGSVRAKLTVDGTVQPLKLRAEGRMVAARFAIGTHVIGDADASVNADVTRAAVEVHSKQMMLLGGTWQVDASYPVRDRQMTVKAAVTHLPLARVRGLLTPHAPVLLAGMISGKGQATLASLDLEKAAADGQFVAQDVGIARAPATQPARTQPPTTTVAAPAAALVTFDTLTARLHLANGKLALDLIHATRGQGVADANAALALAAPGQIALGLKLHDWPLAPTAQGRALVSGGVTGNVDLAKAAGQGDADLTAQLTYAKQPVGTMHAVATLAGTELTIGRLDATAFGGTARGQAEVDFAHPYAARGNLRWQNLHLATLDAFVPQLSGVAGTLTGSATLAPANQPRPIGPLELSADFESDGGAWRGMPIGSGTLTAYAAPARLVLQRSTIHMAGGTLAVWGRVSRHAEDLESTQVHVTASDLDVAMIAHGFDPGAHQMTGRLSGALNLLGTTMSLGGLVGDGSVSIQQANLGKTEIIGGIYDLMHLNFQSGAGGHGTASFRFERGSAFLHDLSFFNRGIELHAAGLLKDLEKSPQSPLNLTFIGSVRPLKNVKLPGVSSLDEIINALQTNVTTIKVTGTIAQPQLTPVVLSEVARDIQELLVGSAEGQ